MKIYSDETPQELALTQDGSESCISSANIYPLSLSFDEKEKAYALVQHKLKFLSSSSDYTKSITSVKYVLSPCLPDHAVMATVLSYAGYRQDIFFLLLNLSQHTEQYLVKNQEKLAPIFVESQPIIVRYLEGDKNCMQDYSEGIKTRQELGQLKFDRKQFSDNVVTEKRPRVVLKNQLEYEGERDLVGRRHGYGVQLDRFGFLYEGQWKCNKVHGFGRQIQPNGTYYIGKWNDHERHGKGRQYFINGSVYDGQWRENKIHGFGKMTYENGTYYEGKWKKGYRHGEGVAKLVNGKLRRGIWDLGKLVDWLSEELEV